jgi:hypothetical protein
MTGAIPPSLRHLFAYSANLAPPEVIGPVPGGIRVNFYVTGGTVEGPRLTGTVLPVGGDWLTLREDGVAVLDVRITLKAADDALILVSYRGIGDLGSEGYERFLRGELPPTLALRTAPVFSVAAPQYQWLHRVLCVSTGEVDFARLRVQYDVFAVD